MRKFIAISLLSVMLSAGALACISEAPTYNRYMFSVFRRESMNSPFSTAMNDYWKRYADDMSSTAVRYYVWNHDRIDSLAHRRGDSGMLRYMRLLDSYLKVCDQISLDSWEYPTKKQLASRKATLLSLLRDARAGMASGMREQNALMVMRANMLLGYDEANIDFWNSTASALPQGVWRDVARNIYARALLNTGRRMEACDIYAEQGDMQSIKWCMRNYRNLAGIQRMYMDNPDSPTLIYLVQDFVNNVQETLDQTAGGQTDEGWIKTIDARAIYKAEALRFVDFAGKVAGEGKTKYPCLWKTAAGMTDYLLGQHQKALTELDEAMTMAGTQRMKDNARCIRLLASVSCSPLGADYSDYLLKEFRWLDSLIKAERGGAADYSNHYTDVKERVVFKALVPKYMAAGRMSLALALVGMMEENEICHQTNGRNPQQGSIWGGGYAWNSDYASWNEYFTAMDTISADKLAAYFRYITTEPADPFERYVVSQVYADSNYYNDIIGTRYLAEGRFAEALPYLDKVSTDFLSQQNISWYMANRAYDVPRWFRHQLPNLPDTDGPGKGEPKDNLKARFCRDIMQLQSSCSLAPEGAQREACAYELAVMQFQASCYGDCWFLTHYGHSIYDSARSGERDFAAAAVANLELCKRSADPKMRYKALYALAFIPVEPWFRADWDNDYNMIYVPQPQASQYRAMSELYRFAKENPQDVDHYTTRCDILKAFARVSGL